ncbi:hypothetical protein V8J82_13060 [Gymnodinialimonas sp. 2305UL16-5]|uniref:hypothetical protein n=1 Tax=Gymnodinialimonas mytili TaxID=3126503 RepID=UPI0030B4D17E
MGKIFANAETMHSNHLDLKTLKQVEARIRVGTSLVDAPLLTHDMLSAIQSIEISGLDLKSLSVDGSVFPNLRSLSISDSLLPEIELFSSFSSLRALSMTHCHLVSLSFEKANLLKLTDLNISRNGFQLVPIDLQSLPELKELNIRNCNIETVRINTSGSRLESLDISENNLSEYTDIGSDKSDLQQLYLSGNILREFPNCISKYNNLKGLALSSNRITSLPREFLYLPILENLWLKANPWQLPPPEIIEGDQKAINRHLSRVFSVDEKTNVDSQIFTVIGAKGAGKTSLCRRILFDQFSEERSDTDIGEYYLRSEGAVQVFIDFGGEVAAQIIRDVFLPFSTATFVVQSEDVISPSFERDRSAPNCVILLNKSDQIQGEHRLNQEGVKISCKLPNGIEPLIKAISNMPTREVPMAWLMGEIGETHRSSTDGAHADIEPFFFKFEDGSIVSLKLVFRVVKEFARRSCQGKLSALEVGHVVEQANLNVGFIPEFVQRLSVGALAPSGDLVLPSSSALLRSRLPRKNCGAVIKVDYVPTTLISWLLRSPSVSWDSSDDPFKKVTYTMPVGNRRVSVTVEIGYLNPQFRLYLKSRVSRDSFFTVVDDFRQAIQEFSQRFRFWNLIPKVLNITEKNISRVGIETKEVIHVTTNINNLNNYANMAVGDGAVAIGGDQAEALQKLVNALQEEGHPMLARDISEAVKEGNPSTLKSKVTEAFHVAGSASSIASLAGALGGLLG